MKITKDSISVALAVYNGEKFLIELLTSLEKQTLRPSELVVLDDHSSDSSLEIINKFQCSFEKKIFSNEKNMGVIYTFQKLASLCTGDFIAFCDQDDIWVPQKLELSFEKIKKLNNNVPAIVFSDLSIINAAGELVQNSFWQQMQIHPPKFSFTDILFGNIVTGCTTLINQVMAKELLKMPLDAIMHDHWMALIAYSFGEHDFISKPTVQYRSHVNAVTDKRKSSLLKVFANDFDQRKLYLQKNIQQAIKFREIYSERVKPDHIKELDKFINLQHKTFFQKRFSRYGRSLMRKFR